MAGARSLPAHEPLGLVEVSGDELERLRGLVRGHLVARAVDGREAQAGEALCTEASGTERTEAEEVTPTTEEAETGVGRTEQQQSRA